MLENIKIDDELFEELSEKDKSKLTKIDKKLGKIKTSHHNWNLYYMGLNGLCEESLKAGR